MEVTVGAALLTMRAAGELVMPPQTAETVIVPALIAATKPELETEARSGAVEFHVGVLQTAVDPSL